MDLLIRLIFIVIVLLITYKWGDWKNWKQYYATILFFILGNFIYLAIFHEPELILWQIESDYIHCPFVDFYLTFCLIPCTILLFFSYYPMHRNILRQITYMLLWSFLYTGVELVSININLISHHNGWSIFHSFIHNCYQFPLLKLHQEKPLIAWLFSFILLGLFIYVFNVPFFKP